MARNDLRNHLTQVSNLMKKPVLKEVKLTIQNYITQIFVNVLSARYL